MPSPSPSQPDPIQQEWVERAARAEQFFSSLDQHLLQSLLWLLHAIALLGKLAIGCAAAYAIARISLRLLGPSVQQRMRRSRLTGLQIVPPIESTYQPEAWIACFRSLYAIAVPRWRSWLFGQPALVFEFLAEAGRVSARSWFPEELRSSVTRAFEAALPGVELRPGPAEALPARPAARLRLKLWRDPLYPLGSARVDALASAVAALAGAGVGIVQIAIAPDTSWERRARRRTEELASERPAQPAVVRLLLKLLSLPLDILFEFTWHSGEPATAAPARSVKPREPLPPSEKAHQACWRAEVRLCCWAASPSAARQELRPIGGAFQALDGENRLRAQRVWWGRGFDRALQMRQGPVTGRLVLSSQELAQLCHLPLLGVPMDTAHVRVAPQRPLGLTGSLLCRLEDEKHTPVLIAQSDRRQHLWLLGPTGSGKSTVDLNLALQDIEAGIGCGLVDPKGDLIQDLLERIPDRCAERVVLLDPSQRDQPLGLNVLDCADEAERELVCDQVVSVFRKTYERFWGPRTEDILRAAILTLLRQPGSTLCEVPILLLNREVRARLTKQLDDPIGLQPFWQEYESFTDGQRAQMVGPVLNKLRAFLLRPTVRNLLGQSRSTLDLAEVMDQGGILLVNLSKGALGEESSALLGAFIVSRIWQTALRRAQRPQDWRPDFNLYLDEFQNYLHLPHSLEDVLAEARAYRLNLTLANQQLGQLHPSVRQAVEANCRSKLIFQLSQEDARHLAHEMAPLTAIQLESLDLHQIAVRLCGGGHTEAAFTGITEPAPPSLGEEHAAEIAERSLRRYGRSRALVEAEIQRRLNGLGYRGDFQEIA